MILGKWKKHSSRIVHRNPWFYVRQDKVTRPDGLPGFYNVVVSPTSVFIVALDKDLTVYLIKLFRYPTQQYSIEIPAGNSDGQPPLIAAKRELQEEAGLIAKKWRLLGKLQSANGMMSERMAVYLASNLKHTKTNQNAEEGIARVFKVPIRKAFDMVRQGEITCAQTAAALMLAAQHLKLRV
jgi:8-oxo-dGTP pyrophosphatase MutT (NUDIX family)